MYVGLCKYKHCKLFSCEIFFLKIYYSNFDSQIRIFKERKVVILFSKCLIFKSLQKNSKKVRISCYILLTKEKKKSIVYKIGEKIFVSGGTGKNIFTRT